MIDHKLASDIVFLAVTIWREARGASDECRSGVGYSILNRVHRPSWWGSDIMSVVFKKWQYSSLTDPKDRQLTTWPASKDLSWWQCMEIADKVLAGMVVN